LTPELLVKCEVSPGTPSLTEWAQLGCKSKGPSHVFMIHCIPDTSIPLTCIFRLYKHGFLLVPIFSSLNIRERLIGYKHIPLIVIQFSGPIFTVYNCIEMWSVTSISCGQRCIPRFSGRRAKFFWTKVLFRSMTETSLSLTSYKQPSNLHMSG
jgi:hypothetical protein